MRGDPRLARREAVPAAPRLAVADPRAAPDPVRPEARLRAGEVPLGAELGVERVRVGEVHPGRGDVAALGQRDRGRLEGLRAGQRTAGGAVALGRLEQPVGVVVEQAPAVRRHRAAVRHGRGGGHRLGALHQRCAPTDLSPTAIARRTASASRSADLLGLLDRVGQRRPSARRALPPATRPARAARLRASVCAATMRSPSRSAKRVGVGEVPLADRRRRRGGAGSWRRRCARVHSTAGSFGDAESEVDLGERVVPPADVEEQLAERALRLGEPQDVAGLARRAAGPARRR